MNLFHAVKHKFRTEFGAKLALTAVGAVLVTLILSTGIGVWNLTQLRAEASKEVEKGLSEASDLYFEKYINAISRHVTSLIEGNFIQLETLATMMQTLIDHPEEHAALGALMSELPYFQDKFEYNAKTNWSQNQPGEPSVIAVWGYLLNADGSMREDIAEDVRRSAIFDLLGPAIMKPGVEKKLQVYFIGPKNKPIMRVSPYVNMGQNFDKFYAGHNETNFWDYFFPKIYEGWQEWVKNPSSRQVKKSLIAVTNPYLDGVTGKKIITFFHPLWNKERTDVAGAVAIDITLQQIHGLVGDVELFQSGFAFLTQSNGNVLAIQDEDAITLGLSTESETSQGVTSLTRNLDRSTEAGIRDLVLPSTSTPEFNTMRLQHGGKNEDYRMVLKRLEPFNFWDKKDGLISESWTLGFVVPTREIYSSLDAARDTIRSTTEATIWSGALLGAVCLGFTLVGVLFLTHRMSSGITELALAAARMANKDYSAQVQVRSKDEIGRLGEAFNKMSGEIERYTSDLEGIVNERTADLEAAAAKITDLNERLKAENIRMGAELDVARQLQMMVLPKTAELEAVPGFDISAYMCPADEVGGDYYDVLQFENLVKIGIGDVTGHGLESGVVMLMVQSVARTLLESGEYDPVKFLVRLNQILCRNMHRIDSDKSLTLSFIDYTREKLTLSGQHEEVIVLRNNASVERIDTIDLGFPIGLEEDISPFVATREIPLAVGETVALYTDGVTEAEDHSGQQFGIDRLCESLARHRDQSAQAIKEAVIRDLRTYIGGQKVFDDISLMILKKVK